MPCRAVVSAGARIVMAIVLLASVALKVSHPHPTPVGGRVGIGAFEDLLIAHEVVPQGLVAPSARLVLVVELALALWLMSHWRARSASLTALALMVVFSAYAVAVHARGGDARCGCFGDLSAADLRLHLAQNLGLGMLCWVGSRRTRVSSARDVTTTDTREPPLI
jgi:hypothetical protein